MDWVLPRLEKLFLQSLWDMELAVPSRLLLHLRCLHLHPTLLPGMFRRLEVKGVDCHRRAISKQSAIQAEPCHRLVTSRPQTLKFAACLLHAISRLPITKTGPYHRPEASKQQIAAYDEASHQRDVSKQPPRANAPSLRSEPPLVHPHPATIAHLHPMSNHPPPEQSLSTVNPKTNHGVPKSLNSANHSTSNTPNS